MFSCIAISFFVYIIYKLIKGDIQCVYGSVLGNSSPSYPDVKFKGDATIDKDGFNTIKNKYDESL